MTVLAVLLTVATVIFATGGVIYGLSKRDECLRAWQKMAAARGLEYRRPSFWVSPKVSGVVNGSTVDIDTFQRSAGKSSVTYTRWRIGVPTALTGDLQIGEEGLGTTILKAFGANDIEVGDSDLDGRLRFQGSEPASIAALCRDPGVREALLRADDLPGAFSLKDGGLRFEQRGLAGADVDLKVDAGLQLAAALTDAAERPWLTLAARRGLQAERRGGALDLSGRSEGRDVRVWQVRDEAGLRTHLRVGAAGTWPRGLLLSKGGGGLTVGDAVLDGALNLQAADPAALRALLGTADQLRGVDLRASLLEVLHGNPGSAVDERGVDLVYTGTPGVRLSEVFDQAWQLAVALDQAAGRAAAPQGAPLAARAPGSVSQ